ncbi:MAG: hypothetical protein GY856_13235 [bacterium]|nr:hypothetical protein [bacterium]
MTPNETDPRSIRFLPLAITRVDERFGCIGAITAEGGWVRPEPTYLTDIEADDSPYRYFHWATAPMGPSEADGPRPEDRTLLDRPCLESSTPEDERETLLVRHLDPSVETAFSGERSLGLVEVELRRFYVKRSTGGRSFIRAEFVDPAGEVYDWIVPDVAFGSVVWPYVEAHQLNPTREEEIARVFREVRRIFFTVGLTKPNDRFPGRFRGCHPLVVGVHTIPAYLPLVAEEKE